jgi:hypothetical protein
MSVSLRSTGALAGVVEAVGFELVDASAAGALLSLACASGAELEQAARRAAESEREMAWVRMLTGGCRIANR